MYRRLWTHHRHVTPTHATRPTLWLSRLLRLALGLVALLALLPLASSSAHPSPAENSSAPLAPPGQRDVSKPPPPGTALTGHHPTGAKPLTPPPTPARPSAPADCVLTGAITTDDILHTQTNNGLPAPSACTPDTCPGLTACCVDWYSDIYTFTNTLNTPQCVTITIDSTGCGGESLFSATYLDTFDPNNPCTNYLGDGSAYGISGVGSYQVTIPANSTFVVDVENYIPGMTCASYTLSVTGDVSGLGCSPVSSPTPTVTGTPPTATPTRTPTSTATATGTATPVCGPAWAVISSPNLGIGGAVLWSAAQVSPNDVWGVGHYWDAGNLQTLVEHYNGTNWSVVPSPDGGERFQGVSVVSANDIWAVGGFGGSTTGHWDGTSWTMVQSPHPGIGFDSLAAVAAVSSNDVWAVGVMGTNLGVQTLLIHWNGSQWLQVPSLNPAGDYNEFLGVTALGPNDVWAVGYYSVNSENHPLVAHWDGTQWTQVPVPDAGSSSALLAVTAVSANDVWAVGESAYGSQALIEHWNGTSWSIVSQVYGGSLHSVAVRAANDIWAVGRNPLSQLYQPLTLHWDGVTWSLVPSPNGNGSIIEFRAVTVASSGEVWAVGASYPGGIQQTLVERYAPRFVDVPQTQTFYSYIEWMACQSYINGYPCGGVGEPCDPQNRSYFRPGNNVTRGQLMKMEVNATGWTLVNPATPTFEDVPTTNTFYSYIETGVSHGVINGYPCGGVGEPCVAPGNRPYFRPNNNITRGQLSKVIALGSAYPLPTPTTATFEDVPPGSTFFSYVEAVVAHGIVGGYPCGSPGEPCLPPANRPYYRPGNDATRGQVSKFVTLANGGP